MQVVIFDKFFKCIYRLRNIPNDWHFDKIATLLDLKHNPSEYQAIRLADYEELCTDNYIYKNNELVLTGSDCSK
jgi:hypothetical protein